jgi:hypothetical protein
MLVNCQQKINKSLNFEISNEKANYPNFYHRTVIFEP